MNKKLIALAVGAAMGLAPMAASAAKVTVYGQLQFELADESVDNSIDGVKGNNVTITKSNWQDNRTIEDNQRGRFGIKASEKLGNGMTAIGQVEYDISASSNESEANPKLGSSKADSSPRIRLANVGLKGNFGTALIGTMKTPYKYWGGVKYDPFVTTNLEARRQGGMSGGDFGQNNFFSNALGYKSPKMNGFQFWGVYSPDENLSGRQDDGDYAAGVKYSNGPMEAFVVFSGNSYNGTTSTVADESRWKIGGKYKMGNHTFLGQYEDLSDINQVNGADGQVYFLGYHFKSGNNTFIGQYGNAQSDLVGVKTALTDDEETDYFAIGMIHWLSKKTRLFGGYSQSSVDNLNGLKATSGDRDAFTVGIRMVF
ncbi:MAG TPA: porin [Gammaproteobacteria bacterium]|nr:porin [Gammaproteobacteria bacterium]